MPWKESSVLDQRKEFVGEYEGGLVTMAELCRIYEISRETGYKWVQRYQEQGWKGLEDLSRSPQRHPNQTAPELEERIVDLRRAHPRWARSDSRPSSSRAPRRSWPFNCSPRARRLRSSS